MTSRHEVFKAINRERSYQEYKWGPLYTYYHPLSVWLEIMLTELEEVTQDLTLGNREGTKQELLQAVAVGVSALEQHGVSEREYPWLEGVDLSSGENTIANPREPFEILSRIMKKRELLLMLEALEGHTQTPHEIMTELTENNPFAGTEGEPLRFKNQLIDVVSKLFLVIERI